MFMNALIAMTSSKTLPALFATPLECQVNPVITRLHIDYHLII